MKPIKLQYIPFMVTIILSIGLFSSFSVKVTQKTTLKIVSYNIRHGEGMDNVLDLSRSAKVINSQKPDLVGLQEVDEYCSRTNGVGQTKYLADNTSMNGTFGKFMDYQGGGYGLATLAAKPIISTEVLKLPDGKFEPRVAIVHEIQISNKCTIAFANVHFDWIDGNEGSLNRLNQAKALVNYVDKLERPTVIIGDFNCTPDSPTMKYFEEQGFVFFKKGLDNLSFQGKEKGEIDHVIYRNAGKTKFHEKTIKLLDEPQVSDHRPLVCELEISY